MDFITFLQNINSNILSSIAIFLNLVLFVQLIVACGHGIYRGWTIGEATVGKILLLTTIAAIMFRLWQSWPHEFAVLSVWPQGAFWVFVGGLVGCTSKWGVERAFLRS
ncbi:MAG: hypothetical protein P2A85_29160 (plasmid) [Microcoleus anatoxicus]|uniref:hypothetical protein n=1 Tax=Microcoleus anatoxicus TaxID=2705319 RepID=UPI00366B0DE1